MNEQAKSAHKPDVNSGHTLVANLPYFLYLPFLLTYMCPLVRKTPSLRSFFSAVARGYSVGNRVQDIRI